MVTLGHTSGHLQVDELIIPGMAGNQLVDQPAPALGIMGIVDAQLAQAAHQPGMVLSPAKGFAAIDRHHFIDTVAEDESAIEHRDPGFADRHEFAVEVDDGVFGHEVSGIGWDIT